MTLTLICGMPRAGKTTYSQRFDNVIHQDGLSYETVKERVAMITGDVVIDGIYQHPYLRSKLIEAYNGKGKRCIWLDTPLEVRKKRPMWHPTHGMTFEPPTYEEGWDEILVLRGDDNEQRCSR